MSKKELLEFQESGKYLFHGSSILIDELKPKQAYTLNKKFKKEKDGVPAVFATPYLDVAIFRAIINRNNAPKNHWSGFSRDFKQISFSVSRETYNQAKNRNGYVYVLDKKDFQPKKLGVEESMDWCSSKSIKPIKPIKPITTIEVKSEDLPENIKFSERPPDFSKQN